MPLILLRAHWNVIFASNPQKLRNASLPVFVMGEETNGWMGALISISELGLWDLATKEEPKLNS